MSEPSCECGHAKGDHRGTLGITECLKRLPSWDIWGSYCPCQKFIEDGPADATLDERIATRTELQRMYPDEAQRFEQCELWRVRAVTMGDGPTEVTFYPAVP